MRTATGSLTLAALALALLVATLAACTPAAPSEGPAYLVPLVSVPTAVHRRALQVLEEHRAAPSAETPDGWPGWADARLWDHAIALHRPDVAGVAYYEFILVGGDLEDALAEPEARLLTGAGAFERGSITLSTGPHDAPVVHWASYGPSLSATIAAFADGRGARVERIYRLDVAAYVGEDARGALVAAIGGNLVDTVAQAIPLLRLEGLDPAWLDVPVEQRTSEAGSEVVGPAGEDDEAAGDTEQTVWREGPVDAPWAYAAWSSWRELKDGYAAAYEVLLEAQRREVAEAWGVEAAIATHGEGIANGERYVFAPLYDAYTVAFEGTDGLALRGEVVERPGLSDAIVVTAVDAQPWSPVTVTLEYPGANRRETLRFFVAEPLGPDLIAPAGAQPWTPWYVSWAQGGHAAQRDYYQVGLYSCSSGCGATAWAMLFGWGDELAWLKLAPWTPRWGLHLGRGGVDLRAPAQQDSWIASMTQRIAIDMGSFCYGDLRATPPWDMIHAAKELSGKTRATIRTNANYFGYGEKRLREIASDQITSQARPAIIGTGFLQHYPLAYGYQFRYRLYTFNGQVQNVQFVRQFHVNNGWQGALGDGWVGSSTWFAGQLRP